MRRDMQRDSQPAVFTALFAAKWAEIKALWWLRRSALLVSLHRPFAQVDESFRKPQPPLCGVPPPPTHKKKTQWKNAAGHRDAPAPHSKPPVALQTHH